MGKWREGICQASSFCNFKNIRRPTLRATALIFCVLLGRAKRRDAPAVLHLSATDAALLSARMFFRQQRSNATSARNAHAHASHSGPCLCPGVLVGHESGGASNVLD